jgi:hypothetical protein
MMYGKPRFTNDFDFVVAIPPSRLAAFRQTFADSGFYVPPMETLLEELRRNGQFNLLHEETGIKVDCVFIKLTEFSRTEFERRQERPLASDLTGFVATPEDIILGKLQYYRLGQSPKHLSDIRGILEISTDEIDFAYLQRWIKELHLENEWQQVQTPKE